MNVTLREPKDSHSASTKAGLWGYTMQISRMSSVASTISNWFAIQADQTTQGWAGTYANVLWWDTIYSFTAVSNWLFKSPGKIFTFKYVSMCVREIGRAKRGNIYPWKPLGLSSCQVSLGFSLHLQDLDVFCPCTSHHAWLIHPELPAASSQDAVQTRMLMEIPARRGYVGKEANCLVKEVGTQMDGFRRRPWM